MRNLFMHRMVGLVVASGFALWLPARGFGKSPHDMGGVGAMGLIGWGTTPEERPAVVDSEPLNYAPVYAAAPATAPAAPVLIAPSRPLEVTSTAVVPDWD